MMYPLERYDDLYHVDEDGNVYGIYGGGRVLKPRVTEKGYLEVKLYKNGIGFNERVHRIVYEGASGQPIPAGMEINHKDGNKTNNKLSNLELVTRQENMQHAIDVLKYKESISRVVFIEGYNLMFESIKEAADFLKINYSTCRKILCKAVKNKYNLSYVDLS